MRPRPIVPCGDPDRPGRALYRREVKVMQRYTVTGALASIVVAGVACGAPTIKDSQETGNGTNGSGAPGGGANGSGANGSPPGGFVLGQPGAGMAPGGAAGMGSARPPGTPLFDGPVCGRQTTPLEFTPVVPDVLIVFDKSGSMSQRFGTGTRLTTERDLLAPLVTEYQDRVRWGFQEFPLNTAAMACPAGMSCCAGPVAVGIAPMNGMAVANAISPRLGSESRINTPTPHALKLAREYYAGLNDGISERYVLLSTDGEPNCPSSPPACDASEQEVKGLLAAGVKTFVLGVSEEVGASQCLDRLARAGGAPRKMGPPFYFPAKDPALLKEYLNEIIGQIAKPSCRLRLNAAPPDPKNVALYFDGVEVPRDPNHMNGWDYDGTMQIVLYGSPCSRVEAAMVKNIQILFGCPGRVIT
jgi:hypothetical protein